MSVWWLSSSTVRLYKVTTIHYCYRTARNTEQKLRVGLESFGMHMRFSEIQRSVGSMTGANT